MSRTTVVALFVAAVCLMGARRGCGGDLLTPEQLCTKSGGAWDSSECPKSCWPPACGASLDQACDSACGKEPVCQCPADKPYWKDGQGCWSAAQCSKSCQGTAKACSEVVGFWDGDGTVAVGNEEDDPCLRQQGCTRDVVTCTQWCHHHCYRTVRKCTGSGDDEVCRYEREEYDCEYYACGTYDCYDGDCKGTPNTCGSISDPDVCGGQEGCSWK